MASRGHKGDIESEIQAGDAEVAAEVATEAATERLKPVAKPNQSEHDATTLALQDEMKASQEKISALLAQIRVATQPSGSTEVRECRDKMKELRVVKDKHMTERQVLFDERDQMRAQQDKIQEIGKQMRGELKFKSLDEIDRAVKGMENQQMHSTMTLKEEKVVVKEIELLKASRKQVGTGSWRLGMVVEQL